MALGLGFNKAKILQSAEKYVLQGKLNAAIDEYGKILKRDPRDLMTLNALGDLYIRAGKTEDAVQCFYELAEKSAEAGFVPRSIAVYKRITKIDSEAIVALTRLGELYSVQGLLRDARTHYLQVVEIHARRRDLNKARDVFEKVLLLDVNNPRLQRRMAELYAQTGKSTEAVASYLSSAERFLDTQEPAEALATLDTLLQLDPSNSDARVLRGRVFLQQGDPAKAVAVLEAVESLSSNRAALNTLFHAYRQGADVDHAIGIGRQLFETHGDFAALALIADDLCGKGETERAVEVYRASAERLEAQGSFPILIEGLQRVLKTGKSSVPGLELLWSVYRRAGNVGEGRETAELLAHAYVAAEQLEKARELYSELVALEPDNLEHQRLLRQVEARIRGVAEPESVTDVGPILSGTAAPAGDSPAHVQALPAHEQELIHNYLTEAELYRTYQQAGRAVEVLEKGLRELPGNVALSEALLPLYEQTSQYQKAARSAQGLADGYTRLGDGERAARYAELAATCQKKAQENGPDPVLIQPATLDPNLDPDEESPAAVAEESDSEQSQVREIDLSMEWAALSQAGPAGAPAAGSEAIIEEMEFYLQAGLQAEALAAFERLQQQFPGDPALPAYAERLGQTLPSAASAVSVDGGIEQPSGNGAQKQESAPLAAAIPEAPSDFAAITATTLPAAPEPILAGFVASPATTAALSPRPAAEQPDLAWDDLVQAQSSAPSGPLFELTLEEAPAPRENASAESTTAPLPISSPVLEPVSSPVLAPVLAPVSWQIPEPVSPPIPQQVPSQAPPQTQMNEASAEPPAVATLPVLGPGFLDDIFAEFKDDLGETAPAEDAETHYNMGIAFKEMALYDEAIGEFQKAHQLAQNVKDYSRVVPCCSLLADCFLEKGMPQLAVKWYQSALDSPGIDTESVLALLFEVGSAYERAGDRSAALKNFLEVYARNIDYRNVAERIRELQQGS